MAYSVLELIKARKDKNFYHVLKEGHFTNDITNIIAPFIYIGLSVFDASGIPNGFTKELLIDTLFAFISVITIHLSLLAFFDIKKDKVKKKEKNLRCDNVMKKKKETLPLIYMLYDNDIDNYSKEINNRIEKLNDSLSDLDIETKHEINGLVGYLNEMIFSYGQVNEKTRNEMRESIIKSFNVIYEKIEDAFSKFNDNHKRNILKNALLIFNKREG